MNTNRLLVTFLVITLLLAGLPQEAGAKKPGGGGGHTETTGNNLSFPVIWSEGTALSLPGTMLQATLTTPYYDYQIDCGGTLAYAYAQKVTGNVWQAENTIATAPVAVNEIDWGDSLESVDMKVGRPVRVELSLYKLLETPMTGYNMVMLANPSSPDEVQGACATTYNDPASILTYPVYEATVYTPSARLVIQKITGANLTWSENQWIGDAEPPITITFAGELNVGGKVIYGLSSGGWKPTSIGEYRITFFMPSQGNTLFDANTTIRLSVETESVTVSEEGGDAGGDAYVDWENNLTYIDITVVGGGGR